MHMRAQEQDVASRLSDVAGITKPVASALPGKRRKLLVGAQGKRVADTLSNAPWVFCFAGTGHAGIYGSFCVFEPLRSFAGSGVCESANHKTVKAAVQKLDGTGDT